jgi:hypothetical protein
MGIARVAENQASGLPDIKFQNRANASSRTSENGRLRLNIVSSKTEAYAGGIRSCRRIHGAMDLHRAA